MTIIIISIIKNNNNKIFVSVSLAFKNGKKHKLMTQFYTKIARENMCNDGGANKKLKIQQQSKQM